jgi:hypothetical protein
MRIHKISALSLVFVSFLAGSCREKPAIQGSEEGFDYTWREEYALSFTDINNFAIGYAAEDEESLDKGIAEIILDAVKEGNLEVTSLEGQQLSSKEALALLRQTYPQQRETADDGGDFQYEMVERQIEAEDIIQMVSREEWLFNEETYQLQKRVSHLAPAIYVYDPDGTVRGKKMLFWVKLN